MYPTPCEQQFLRITRARRRIHSRNREIWPVRPGHRLGVRAGPFGFGMGWGEGGLRKTVTEAALGADAAPGPGRSLQDPKMRGGGVAAEPLGRAQPRDASAHHQHSRPARALRAAAPRVHVAAAPRPGVHGGGRRRAEAGPGRGETEPEAAAARGGPAPRGRAGGGRATKTDAGRARLPRAAPAEGWSLGAAPRGSWKPGPSWRRWAGRPSDQQSPPEPHLLGCRRGHCCRDWEETEFEEDLAQNPEGRAPDCSGILCTAPRPMGLGSARANGLPCIPAPGHCGPGPPTRLPGCWGHRPLRARALSRCRRVSRRWPVGGAGPEWRSRQAE